MTSSSIRHTLERIGRALSSGDAAAVAELWDIPALVLSDAGAIAVSDRREVEEFFARAVSHYRSRGLVATRPEIEKVDLLTEGIASVQVRWAALDGEGVEQASERSHYILGRGDDDVYRVRVAVTLTGGE